MLEEQFLKARAAQENCGAAIGPSIPGLGSACREPTAKEMLLEKAESLRREAHDLETLARELPPEGAMSPSAERTLRHTVAFRIHR